MGAMDGGGSDEPVGCEERILVSVRLRPLNEREIVKGDASDWECINGDTIIFRNSNLPVPERSMYPTAYTFDRVFGSDCSTRQVYEEGARRVALSVVSGINSSIFAYGQTSSGKTYTMSGITEYTVQDIYDYIKKHAEREFILKFSAMEIYNESVRDLLSVDCTPLRLLDDPERGTIIEKLIEETVRDWDHVIELLSICEAQRQIGETSLNEASSRSHQIIRLTIESSAREFLGKDNSSTLAASVNFVDLAGSERASQALSAGMRLKEGSHINRSLLTLGTVIRKLSKGRNGHIPYRDSKLTRILQSSLGGNARTAIICTMSPARSHVEQSRNTLLFACCAKEVTTNAQVNVVMSDKALVKHLQRELARLETELRSPRAPFAKSDYEALLRHKDMHIEKLEKEIIDLTLQRDVAQSQVHDLLRLIRDDGDSIISVGLNNYPDLRVRRSPDSEKTIPDASVLADHNSLGIHITTFGTPKYSDRHSGSSFGDHYIHLPDLEGNFMHNGSSPTLLVCRSGFNRNDSHHGWGEIVESTDGSSEDLCKEVRCIETEDSNTAREVQANSVSPATSHGISEKKDDGDVNEDRELLSPDSPPLKEHRELNYVDPSTAFASPEKLSPWPHTEDSSGSMRLELTKNSPPLKEHRELSSVDPSTVVASAEKLSKWPQTEDSFGSMSLELIKNSPPLKEHRELSSVDPSTVVASAEKLSTWPQTEDSFGSMRLELTKNSPPLKEHRELSSVNPSTVVASPEKFSPWLQTEDSFGSVRLKLKRSRSCRASLMISSSPSLLFEAEKHENTPAHGFEKDFVGRPEGFPTKPIALKYDADIKNLSRKPSRSSIGSAITDAELLAENIKTSTDKRFTSIDTCVEGVKEMAEQQHEKQVAESPEQKMEPEDIAALKNVKDVGLDPMDDGSRSPSDWPSEFKRLQGDIIKLWDACNVSLVHRTHFFLLFNGDPSDSIYMQVELRRLSFLKDSLSQGSQIVENGWALTPASSIKALRREREMLSKEMQKKLSEQERESLFLKWGIRLNSKHRRLQLANTLWTKTEDMEHIADSAIVVAKLVGFIEKGQAPKEMFELNFSAQRSRRKSYSIKRSVISLL